MSERARQIDDYVKTHPACNTERIERYELAGEIEKLVVLRLPLSYLVYNIRNGRFAAELMELEADLGRFVDPLNPEDAGLLEELLLRESNAATYLIRDIQRRGQLNHGAIAHDGRIVDGNRRVAVLRRLYEETGEEKFNYFEAVRLPPDITPKDLWRIEAGLQLAYDLKAAYGPINELLKIREGLQAEISRRVMAIILGGDNTVQKVKEKEERLSLITEYLAHTGQPNKFSAAERRHEHFINLQNIMRRKHFKGLSSAEKTKFILRAYDYIASGVGHMKIREMGKVLAEADVTRDFLKEAHEVANPGKGVEEEDFGEISVEEASDILDQILEEESDVADVDEEEETLEGEAGARPDVVADRPLPVTYPKVKKELLVVLEIAVDRVDARREREKPRKLLKKAVHAIETLSEIEASKLRPLRVDMEGLARILGDIIDKIKG